MKTTSVKSLSYFFALQISKIKITYQKAIFEDYIYSVFITLLLSSAVFNALIQRVLVNNKFSDLIATYAGFSDLAVASRLLAIKIVIIFSIVCFHIHLSFLANVQNRKIFNSFSVILLFPAILWIASLFFSQKKSINFEWILYSLALFECWLIYCCSRFSTSENNIIKPFLIIASLLPFAVTGFRAFLSLRTLIEPSIYVVIVSVFIVILVAKKIRLKEDGSFLILTNISLQALSLLLIFNFFPNAIKDDKDFYSFSLLKYTIYIVLPLAIFFIYQILKDSAFSVKRQIYVSPIVLGIIVAAVMIPGHQVATIAINEFELGARLPAYELVTKGISHFFKEVQITYGFSDFFPLKLAEILSGDLTVATAVYGYKLWEVLLFILGTAALSYLVNPVSAVLVCFAISHSSFFFPILFFALILKESLLQNKFRWIWVWLGCSLMLPFLRIPQGSLCVACTIPIAMYQFYQLSKNARDLKKLFYTCLVGVPLLFLLEYHSYAFSLIQNHLEYASVNSLWAANDWGLNYSIQGFQTLAQAFISNLSIIMPLASLLFAIYIGKNEKNLTLIFAIVTVIPIYVWLSISYGFSRTDNIASARQYGIYIQFLVTVYLLLSSRPYFDKIKIPSLFVFLFLLVGKTNSLKPFTELYIESRKPAFEKTAVVKGEDIGLPKLGHGVFDKKFLDEALFLKNELDHLLPAGQPFFNFSLYGLNYFTTDRPLGIEYPTIYVYPTPESQIRAIQKMQRDKVSVAYIDFREPYDFVSSPLRSYFFYRYVLMSNLPVTQSEYGVIFANPDLKTTFVGNTAELISLLEKLFNQNFLGYTSSLWFDSIEKLESKLDLVYDLKDYEVVKKTDLTCINFKFPQIISGWNIGMIKLEFNTKKKLKSFVNISWKSENQAAALEMQMNSNGLLIPIDISPNWLMSKEISSMQACFIGGDMPDLKEAKMFSRNDLKKLVLDQPLWTLQSPKLKLITKQKLAVGQQPNIFEMESMDEKMIKVYPDMAGNEPFTFTGIIYDESNAVFSQQKLICSSKDCSYQFYLKSKKSQRYELLITKDSSLEKVSGIVEVFKVLK